MSHLLDTSSYALSIYALPTLLTMVAIFVLGIVALVHERFSPVSVAFFAITLAVSIWLFAQSMLFSSRDDAVALWWARAAYLGVPFIASATYHFTVVVLREFQRFWPAVLLGWVLSALFSALSIATGALFYDLYHYPWGGYARFQWLGLPFIIFFMGLLLASMVHYWFAYRSAPPGTHKRRIRALMVAFGVGYLGALDLIPAYGVQIYPFGYLAILGFVVLAARAIFIYRLVDITPAFAANEIINTMNDGLLVLDAEGVVRLVNQATEDMLRRPREELLGNPVSANLDDPLFADRAQFNDMVKQGGLTNYELNFEVSVGDSRCLSLSVSVKPGRDEDPVAIVCILRDITRRKQAEEQMRRQNAYLAALHQTSLGLVRRLELSDLLEAIIQRASMLVGAEHGYIYVVQQGEDGQPVLAVEAGIGLFAGSVGARLRPGEGLAGRVWQQAETLTVGDYGSWPGGAPTYKEMNFHAVIGTPLVSGEQVTGVLGLAYTEEGRTFTQGEIELLERFAQLASIALDNARLYSAARIELVERKRAEREVKVLNRDLERRVAERTAQLEAAVKELEAFSYSVSHDLRAPLRAVTGFSNAVLEDHADKLDAGGQRYLRLIRDSALNMGQLIDDLLAFSRVGRQQMASSEIDMTALARSIFKEIRIADPGRDVDFVIARLPPAQGDRALIRQVFANLLQNAVKFTRGRDHARVEVGFETTGGENVYFVRDNGAGFDMRYAHKLFGVFQRLHSASEFEGTGVGLALVQRIISRHGGRVWAEARLGGGATFYFTLPGTQKETPGGDDTPTEYKAPEKKQPREEAIIGRTGTADTSD